MSIYLSIELLHNLSPAKSTRTRINYAQVGFESMTSTKGSAARTDHGEIEFFIVMIQRASIYLYKNRRSLCSYMIESAFPKQPLWGDSNNKTNPSGEYTDGEVSK